MKLKAVASEDIPEELLNALDDSSVVETFKKIAIKYLRVEESCFGPATHYVQKTDLSIKHPSGCGIEVTLSKVSVTDDRAPNDFQKALCEIKGLYKDLIRKNSKVHIQLFVCVILDKPIEFTGKKPSSLLETQPEWIYYEE